MIAKICVDIGMTIALLLLMSLLLGLFIFIGHYLARILYIRSE